MTIFHSSDNDITMRKTNNHTRIELSRFVPPTGVCEYQAMIHITSPELDFEQQLAALLDACHHLRENELHGARAVFERYFLSDAANQTQYLLDALTACPACSRSIVEQPPLDGSKIALWVYLQTEAVPQSFPGNQTGFVRNGYTHLWTGYRYQSGDTSEEQTRQLLNRYLQQLQETGGTLADNCVRTWFFVQNVDVNYAGVVKARNDVFRTQRLTPDTHFIASTGIGGRHADPTVFVLMDAYSVLGISPEQIRYLYARTHLNPTYEYGVSFERGTCIDYGDRRHTFISGTASIDHRGQIVHPGDIRQQTFRMWENVEALLREADMDFSDMGAFIVYLRDIADYHVVRKLFQERFPHHPTVIVLAPVCRPGWLIEMECMGVRFTPHPEFRNY